MVTKNLASSQEERPLEYIFRTKEPGNINYTYDPYLVTCPCTHQLVFGHRDVLVLHRHEVQHPKLSEELPPVLNVLVCAGSREVAAI